MPVLSPKLHNHTPRGDPGMEKYDETLQLGNTTVHVVSPGKISEEEKEKILDELHAVGWAIIHELNQEKSE